MGALETRAERALSDLVDTYYRYVDARQMSDLVALFAPDAVYYRPGYEPLVGRDALSRFYAGERVIEAGQHVIENRVVSGGQVAIQGRFQGVLNDGTRVHVRFADFFRMEHGLIVERSSYVGDPIGRPI